MTLVEEIQAAVKSGKAVIGCRESLRFIKLNAPKLIVVAKNMAENDRKEVERNASVGGTRLEVFEGSSKELGIICGKPFPVTTVIIK